MADKEAVFGDEFVADEILARLPARCAVRCVVLSKRFRQLLRTPHFWLRRRRLGAPGLELPHVACLYKDEFPASTFYFQVVGPALATLKHTVNDEEWLEYVNTCNGLVLLTDLVKGPQSFVHGVVFNPATKEEVRLSVPFPPPTDKEGESNPHRSFLGFAYAPSSKVYKALICVEGHHSTRLMVVSLGCQQEPRTLFSYDEAPFSPQCLHMGDGKIYILIDNMNVFEHYPWFVLAFDADDEIITRIDLPKKESHTFNRMLVVCGRPCIYENKGQDTVLWLLTPDHRWERRYILVKQSSYRLSAALDCGGGLLFAKFACGAYLYNLKVGETVGEEEQGGGTRLVAVGSMRIQYEIPESFKYTTFETKLWDYHPTLISPASIFGDAALISGHCAISDAAPNHELAGTFVEMTHKLIIDPAMQMLSSI
ncbi:hypothetical protein VPH35_033385 [Triticum aestivum]